MKLYDSISSITVNTPQRDCLVERNAVVCPATVNATADSSEQGALSGAKFAGIQQSR